MRKLLIVDDDPGFVSFVTTVAEELGYETASVDDGLEVEAVCSDFSPDVILIDMVLPGKDGIEVLKALTDAGTTARIVLVSGHSTSFLNAGLAIASASGVTDVQAGEKPCSLSWLRDVLT